MRLHRFKKHKEIKIQETISTPESVNESVKLFNEEARVMVGDNKSPNIFFVTLGYGHIYDEVEEESYSVPNTIQKNAETIAMVDTIEEAMKIVDQYELDMEEQDNMLTEINIEDRKHGTVYQKSIHKDAQGDLDEVISDDRRMLRESINMILESRQLTKALVQKGELSAEDYATLEQTDPTPQKKYLYWMAKQFLAKNATLDQLRNSIEEFELFLKRGRVKDRDINVYKDYASLKRVVDELNEKGVKSNKELEDDYEVVEDTDDLYIAVPHTHEASRKLGLSKFAYRKRDDCGSDSAWCTTYKTDSHFLDYYYNQKITFYYVLVKSETLKLKLKKIFGKDWEDKTMVAMTVHENGNIDAYDAMDARMSDLEIKKFRKAIDR